MAKYLTRIYINDLTIVVEPNNESKDCQIITQSVDYEKQLHYTLDVEELELFVDRLQDALNHLKK
jgi:hypothetical protein